MLSQPLTVQVAPKLSVWPVTILLRSCYEPVTVCYARYACYGCYECYVCYGCYDLDYGDADERLPALCQPVRRKLEDLAHQRASLREIANYFHPIFEQVSAWKLPVVETARYGSHPPTRFNVPRLSDWLERK